MGNGEGVGRRNILRLDYAFIDYLSFLCSKLVVSIVAVPFDPCGTIVWDSLSITLPEEQSPLLSGQ